MSDSARRIRIPNPDIRNNQISGLGADYTSGTSLTLVSTNGFEANSIIVVGNPGSDKSSSAPISSVDTITGLTLSAGLDHAYSKGTPVYRSEYDQIELGYYSGGWTVITTFDIQWDVFQSEYIHQGGVDATQYRFRFKNSLSGNYSEYSNTAIGSGFTKKQMGYLISNIRKVILDHERKVVSDTELLRYLNEAKDIIIAKTPKKGWWFWRKESLGDITTVASTSTYDLDTISESIEYILDVRYKDIKENILYQLMYRTEFEFDELISDLDREDDDAVTQYTLTPPDSTSTSGYIKLYPTPENTLSATLGGSLYIRYYQPDADYDDVSDTTLIPLPYIMEDYAVAQCFKIMGQDDKAKFYLEKFYGVGEDRKKFNAATGINLLELMNQRKGSPLPRVQSIKRFMGRNAFRRLYGNRSVGSSDDYRERYW